jgi:hypothetical protein
MDDAALWDAFSQRTLPAAAWTHAAHLRIAWMHLEHHALDEAHILMRIGIVRLNMAHGLVETPVRGYHETITRIWLALVADARSRHPAADSGAFLAAAGPELAVNRVFTHYTREYLMGTRARAVFVPADLVPLPA